MHVLIDGKEVAGAHLHMGKITGVTVEKRPEAGEVIDEETNMNI